MARYTSSYCGVLLRRIRDKHGLTQSELAQRAGCSKSRVSRIERGLVSPRVDELQDIFAVMGEALVIRAVYLGEPVAGNSNVEDLKRMATMTPNERLEEARILSEEATRLAAQGWDDAQERG